MKKLLIKSCAIGILFLYSIVSQFIFKAVATTTSEPVNLEVDTVCYGKIIDAFESKYSCRKGSFTSQAGTEKILIESSFITFSSIIGGGFVLETMSVTAFDKSNQLIRPPPDTILSRVEQYSYIGVLKSLI